MRNFMRRFRRLRLPALILGPPMLPLLVYSVFIEPHTIEINRHEIGIRDLPREFDGFRTVQLSDIHVGAWMSLREVDKFIAIANAQRPDAVLITGDFATRLSNDFDGLGMTIGGLKARHGVYAVLGNHDYWEDEAAITAALRENGVDVLFDESRDIDLGGQRIRIVGTDDIWEGSPDFDQAFEDIEERDVCIALAHNPDAAMQMDGRLVDLLLAGHTHGGLVNIPGVGAIISSSRLGRKVVSGLHQVNDMPVYINRGLGTGTTLIPMRFRCKPEMTVFTLRRAGNSS